MKDFVSITTEITQLDATLAEVLVHADFDLTNWPPSVPFPMEAVRKCFMGGQVTGPRCPGSETIEIAYAIQQVRSNPKQPLRITGSITIPEPNLWEPETPFVYGGVADVYEEGRKLLTCNLEFGLRQKT